MWTLASMEEGRKGEFLKEGEFLEKPFPGGMMRSAGVRTVSRVARLGRQHWKASVIARPAEGQNWHLYGAAGAVLALVSPLPDFVFEVLRGWIRDCLGSFESMLMHEVTLCWRASPMFLLEQDLLYLRQRQRSARWTPQERS